MKKTIIWTLSTLLILSVFFRFLCGIFIIQPIGALPEGATIIYWRYNLNLPFISSADGMLEQSGAGVSLLGRGMMMAAIAKPVTENEIIRFGYSETLYLWSTGGKSYEK